MFDRIIVSTDENSMFIQFISIVSKAWKKYFPDKKLSIAFLSNRTYNDPLVKRMQDYGDVKIFHPVFGIPIPNQAKMVRHILASEYENEVCMIEDMDTIPLQREFFIDRTSKRKENTLLQVGSEVLTGACADKIPISTMTAEGRIFKEFINPKNLHYIDLLNSWKYMPIKTLDNAQDINNSPNGVPHFSDESLIAVLLKMWNPDGSRITKIKRDVDIHKYWIDRSWWNVNKKMLEKDEYVCCNFLRPFESNYEHIKPVVKHIFGDNINKEKVIFK